MNRRVGSNRFSPPTFAPFWTSSQGHHSVIQSTQFLCPTTRWSIVIDPLRISRSVRLKVPAVPGCAGAAAVLPAREFQPITMNCEI